ncbi:DUF3575 domain-containing protein [Membranicola marinus]|uniref:DUF3575 domain-containing protein n=1 Tax=Membranihabitans marinus TaxID=1227546 RepID=A0A953HNN9_9BACT|nr:DUF3575 domain-containing protein [Membranihabitans marinus]MBY5959334.1 DUF3575 domain-containing protein [Membranihabitans marinus]
MKNFFFSFPLLFFVSGLFAQTDVTINPIGLLFSNIGISAERPISDNFGLEGTANFSFSPYNVFGDDFSSNGFGLRALGKYYFKPDQGIDKFNIGPYARFGYNSINFTGDKVKNIRLAVGFYAGYKWVSKGHIIFELGLGLGRAFLNNYSSNDASFDAGDWPGFNIDGTGKLAIGYRFGTQ